MKDPVGHGRKVGRCVARGIENCGNTEVRSYSEIEMLCRVESQTDDQCEVDGFHNILQVLVHFLVVDASLFVTAEQEADLGAKLEGNFTSGFKE